MAIPSVTAIFMTSPNNSPQITERTTEAKGTPVIDSHPLNLLIAKVQVFFNEVKGHPGFPNSIPESKRNDLMLLTEEVKQNLKANPFIDFKATLGDLEKQYNEVSASYNKEMAKIQEALFGGLQLDPSMNDEEKNQFKEVFGGLMLSEMMFDCGRLTKHIEKEMSTLKTIIGKMKVIVDFMDSNEAWKESENQPIPLIVVLASIQGLIDMGVIKVELVKGKESPS